MLQPQAMDQSMQSRERERERKREREREGGGAHRQPCNIKNIIEAKQTAL